MSEPAAKKILVADDVKVLALKVSGALSARGYETAIASDGEQCLEMVESFAPDLLILDIMMPKVHGIEVLKRIKSTKLGVIVCTAKDYKTDVSKFRELGAIDIVIKPIDRDELLGKVARFFARGDALDHAGDGAAAIAAPKTDYRHELKPGTGRCRLWGTRGSIPVSEPRYVRHGGNTSCMSIVHGEHRLIFDAGSGIRPLGAALVEAGPRKIHLFITHTHWDHIQGFPFFAPIHVPGFEITVYGAEGFGMNLESLFRGQLDRDYFPVQYDDLASTLEFVTLPPEPIEIGEARISCEYTQHPGATVGYRVDLPGRSIAWVPDNEFLKGYVDSPIGFNRYGRQVTDYEPIIEFLSGADILFHEAQYTHAEYLGKIGWGHSSVPNACLLAKICRPRRWVIVHHDPMHDDQFLQQKLTMTRQLLGELEFAGELAHGFDGWTELL